jgi:hypothetical protein
MSFFSLPFLPLLSSCFKANTRTMHVLCPSLQSSKFLHSHKLLQRIPDLHLPLSHLHDALRILAQNATWTLHMSYFFCPVLRSKNHSLPLHQSEFLSELDKQITHGLPTSVAGMYRSALKEGGQMLTSKIWVVDFDVFLLSLLFLPSLPRIYMFKFSQEDPMSFCPSYRPGHVLKTEVSYGLLS